VHEAINVVKHF